MNTQEPAFSTEVREGKVILRVGLGRLGVEEVDPFGKHLMSAVETGAGRTVILDLGDVATLSSVVVGKLFRARKEILSSGGQLVIVTSNDNVLHTLTTCDLHLLMAIHSSVEDALASGGSS